MALIGHCIEIEFEVLAFLVIHVLGVHQSNAKGNVAVVEGLIEGSSGHSEYFQVWSKPSLVLTTIT